MKHPATILVSALLALAAASSAFAGRHDRRGQRLREEREENLELARKANRSLAANTNLFAAAQLVGTDGGSAKAADIRAKTVLCLGEQDATVSAVRARAFVAAAAAADPPAPVSLEVLRGTTRRDAPEAAFSTQRLAALLDSPPLALSGKAGPASP